ncbi:MAG: D-alanyl-D-alanine carboxypeptidase family protein [Patescibacteria group bacterium]
MNKVSVSFQSGFIQLLPLVLLAAFAVSTFLIVSKMQLEKVGELRRYAKEEGAYPLALLSSPTPVLTLAERCVNSFPRPRECDELLLSPTASSTPPSLVNDISQQECESQYQGCYVTTSNACVPHGQQNSGYYCCKAGTGSGVSYNHFQLSSCDQSVGASTRTEATCTEANGCWVSGSGKCVEHLAENAGYCCYGANEGGNKLSYPHFEQGSCMDYAPTIIITPTLTPTNSSTPILTPTSTTTMTPTPITTPTPTKTPTPTPTISVAPRPLPPSGGWPDGIFCGGTTLRLCSECSNGSVSFGTSFTVNICGPNITASPTPIPVITRPSPSPTALPGPIIVPYAPTFTPTTIKYQGVEVDADIVSTLDSFILAASQQGYNVVVYSGYRSYQEQENLYNGCQLQKQNGQACRVATPGYSQHQSGHAVDLYIYENGEYKPMIPLIPLAISMGLEHPIPTDTPHFYIP